MLKIKSDYVSFSSGQILIVDNDCAARDDMCKILKQEYAVLEAESTKEAIEILSRYKTKILLILTAVSALEMDEKNLLDFLKKDSEFFQIPVVVTAYQKQLERASLFLDRGADEILSKPTQEKILRRRLRNVLLLRKKTQFPGEDNFNQLTGLLKKRVFSKAANQFFQENKKSCYMIAAIDIENFKLFNSWYGFEMGNMLLSEIGTCLGQMQHRYNGLASYMGEDNFALILPDKEEFILEIQKELTKIIKNYGDKGEFRLLIGVAALDSSSNSAEESYDRALLGLKRAKKVYYNGIGYYSRELKERLERNQILHADVRKGLERNEFFFELQPKCDMRTGKIVGAEALARWKHPVNGLVSPGEFIPSLEKSGLITPLDYYIWEEVCKTLRRWLDCGYQIVPISVNVSRMDIYSDDMVEVILRLMERYRLSGQWIELEITEGVFAEDNHRLLEVVEQLRQHGFSIVMDDFGKGYSSLNMLKEISVDMLKLDMRFLTLTEGSMHKGANILESVVRMGNLLNLPMVSEGVETKEQLDFLLNRNCMFGQGFYFYRPMGVEEFEQFLKEGDKIDPKGIRTTKIGKIYLRKMLDEKIISDAAVNSILGPVAFYDMHEGVLSLYCANSAYCSMIGYNETELESVRSNLLENVHEEDQNSLLNAYQTAFDLPMTKAEVNVRHRRKDGKWHWIHMSLFFFNEQSGHLYYYAALEDITKKKNYEESAKRIWQAAKEVSGAQKEDSFMQLDEEEQHRVAAIFAQMNKGGMIGGYCESGFPLYFANSAMVELLEYDNYEDFAAGISYQVENTIYEEDRERISREIGQCYPGKTYTVTYRMVKKTGDTFWVLDKGEVVIADDGRLAIISACTDISETMEAQRVLMESNQELMHMNDELSFLNDYLPAGYHRCAATPEYDFLYISNRFVQMFGYQREEIKELFDNKYLNMVHPDDRKRLKKTTERLRNVDKSLNQEYRMMTKKGYIWVIDQTRYLEYNGKGLYQGVVMEVTDKVKLRDCLNLLIRNTPVNYVKMKVKENRHIDYEIISNGAYEKLGYTAVSMEQLLNHDLFGKFVQPDDIRFLKERVMEKIEKQKNFSCSYRIKSLDGAWKQMKTKGYLLAESLPEIEYLCVSIDVEDMKSNWGMEEKEEMRE